MVRCTQAQQEAQDTPRAWPVRSAITGYVVAACLACAVIGFSIGGLFISTDICIATLVYFAVAPVLLRFPPRIPQQDDDEKGPPMPPDPPAEVMVATYIFWTLLQVKAVQLAVFTDYNLRDYSFGYI